MKNLLGKGSVYIGILLKMIGITYVAEFSSNLCADAGYHAIADQIEFYGKIMIMAVSLPILLTLVDTIATI
ncbi:stage III sporulation protein AD [Clostridium sp. CAG:230]|nr:stage III sporulation protein AD [Clostridium sp. CAG:230]